MTASTETNRKTSSLTTEQIQAIFDFTAKKYVKFYDVQLELVDHIGSKIEEMMEKDDHLKFDDALYKVYKSFGIYGFTKLQEQKVNEMMAFWQKKIWRFYLQYFKLPKIILSLTLVSAFYFYFESLSQWINGGWLIYITLLLISVMYMIMGYKNRKEQKRRIASPLLVVHSFEMVTMGFSLIGTSIFISIGPKLSQSNSIVALPFGVLLGASILATILLVNFHAIFYVFPDLLKEEVKKHYAHMKLEIA